MELKADKKLSEGRFHELNLLVQSFLNKGISKQEFSEKLAASIKGGESPQGDPIGEASAQMNS